jgi:ATPase subunit of ABC transporter with duplicated ATPase domains
MVVGEETPDEGAVSVPKKLTIGYFRQDVEEMQGRSVLDEAIAGSGRVGWPTFRDLRRLRSSSSAPSGLAHFPLIPRAYALGCIFSPLRGYCWCVSLHLQE